MSEKKDDSEGRNNNLSDTAELLESLFKDTKDTRIKLVRRKPRPKSGKKKRVGSKQRKESVKKTSKTRVAKQGRPSEPKMSSGATKEKRRVRKASLPGSRISDGSKIKPTSVQRSTADTKPTSTIRKDHKKEISKTAVLKKERGPSMTRAGTAEDKAAIPETAEIVFDSVDQRGDASAGHGGVTGADETITEVLEKSAISSMIPSVEAGGEEAQQRSADEQGSVPEDEETAEIVFDSVDQRGDASAAHGGVAGADETITEVLEKSAIGSMISSLEASREEAQQRSAAEEGSVPEDEETAEIVFDSGDQRGDASAGHGGVAEADETITEVLEKSAISSMISSLEASREETQLKSAAEEDSLPEDEKERTETAVEAGAPEERPLVFSRIGTAGKEELLTQEERVASSSIGDEDSLLKATGHEAYSESTPEEKPISEDENEGVETVVEAGAPEERLSDPADIVGAVKEEPPFQEERAVSSSIGDEDSLLEASGHETYSELTPEEKPISDDEKEGEDSLIVTDEEDLLHEQVAEEGAVAEEERDGVDETLEEEGTTPEDKENGFEKIQEAVGLEQEPPLDPVTTEPTEEKPLFQEQPAPALGPSDDSLAGRGEQDLHHRQAAEDEPMVADGEDDIEEVSRLEKPREDEPVDLEGRIEELMKEIQSLRSSARRAMLLKVVLPLVLFAIVAVFFSLKFMPLDSFKREKEAVEIAKEEMAETPEPKKPDTAPETSKKVVAAVDEEVRPSASEPPPIPAKEETAETPKPKKPDTAPETSKKVVAAVKEEVRPSTSEPPPIPAKEEMAEIPERKKPDTAPETSKKVVAAVKEEVRPSTSEPPPIPPKEETVSVAEQDVEHSDAAGKAEAVQEEAPELSTFSIFLGSYGVLKEAEKAVAKYKRKDIFPYVSEVYLGDKVEFYRVFTGRFEDKAQAEEYIESKELKGAKVWKIE